jgi:TPP-dependent pyruvate/acetoin dehydrogenase alpha subunit
VAEVEAAQQTKQPGVARAETAQNEQTGAAGSKTAQNEQTGAAGSKTAQNEHTGATGSKTARNEQTGAAGSKTAQNEQTAVAGSETAQQIERGAVPATLFLEGYARMYLIRLFENAMHRLFLAGEVHGTTHLYVGQEAVAVGVCLALRSDDYVAGTYRGHGHALAKGTAPAPLVAEMLGRASGVCGSRAGSMNVVDLEHGLIGCYGIVGGSIAAALGAALSGKRQGRVAVAMFGDGAVNQAYFHECLNMAKVLSLPEVFVCENNFYGEFTPMASVTAGTDIAGRARAYDIPSAVVDGNDLWAVHAAAAAAVERARHGGGPTLLECRTYRHYGHSKSDPAPYRPKAEVEEWLARDPLKIARARLLQEGVPEEQLSEAEQRASALIDRAVEDALAAPYPDPTATVATEFRP